MPLALTALAYFATALVAMALLLARSLRAGDRPTTDDVLDAINDIALEA